MTKRDILVTGDFVLDHHIYEGQRHHYGDRRHRGVREVEELGGAALIHYLLAELKGEVTSHLSVAVGKNDASRTPSLPKGVRVPSELSAYAIWRPFGNDRKTSPEQRMWRTEDAMGFGGLPEPDVPFKWPKADGIPNRPDIIVLSDGGMGFRENPPLWPDDASLKQARWIVLKTTHPLAEGALWQRLTRPEIRSRLVVIVSSNDLRKGSAHISSGLSWDATVDSVLTALAPGGEHQALTCGRHLLIAFGTEGGLWLETAKTFTSAKTHLVYDAESVEGDQYKPQKGKAFGALSCLAAAAAWRLAKASGATTPDLAITLEGSLSAMHDLLNKGHGSATAPGKGFPAKRLAKVIGEATCRYSRTQFSATAPMSPPRCAKPPSVAVGDRCWSVMHEALRQQGQKCPEPAWDLAEQVARHGPIALGSLPHLRIGNLISADRREIESLRILRGLIQSYMKRPNTECKKPLSIGVFGPPGSGKSFAVKEIARKLAGEEGWMEFNLSQFRIDTTADLIGAFHQIRDRVLRAQTPVAFFDEFDARDYAWLQYLLAPMQDGAFQEGQITHPIGKCIFIFAGATGWSFESFGPPEKSGDAFDAFRMAKGPDFKSRLDGFLDILGPNQRELVTVDNSGRKYSHTPDPCDIFYPVRRALVIRAELRCKPEDKLAIDDGLLRALLRVGKYKHGARSISKLVEPLKEGCTGTIRRSLLPPTQQIDLHAEAGEFLQQCESAGSPIPAPPLPDPTPVAEVIHEKFRMLGRDQGWLEEHNDIGYSKLHDFYKQSNLAAANRMVSSLALIGLALEKGRNTAAEREAIRLRIEYNLELLAAAEHTGWMDWHLDQGWQYGPVKPPTNYAEEPEPDKRFHPCLKFYRELSDKERNKDRNTVRFYLDFAAAAGMKIVPRDQPPPRPRRPVRHRTTGTSS